MMKEIQKLKSLIFKISITDCHSSSNIKLHMQDFHKDWYVALCFSLLHVLSLSVFDHTLLSCEKKVYFPFCSCMKKMRSVRTTMVVSGKERNISCVSSSISLLMGGEKRRRERVKSITVNWLLFATTSFRGGICTYMRKLL